MTRHHAARAAFALLLAVCLLAPAALAYDLGDDVTLCWATYANDGGVPITVRENCGDSYTEFTYTPFTSGSETLYSSTEYQVTFEAKIGERFDQIRPTASGGTLYSFPHANIHSCLRSRVTFCTPFVSNTPELSTHSGSVPRDVDPETNVAQFLSPVVLPPAEYTVIAHTRWYDVNGTKHDMARALFLNFEKPAPPKFDCPPGSVYTIDDGEAFCTPCPEGTFEEKGYICTMCPPETYNDEEGKDECKPCPENSMHLEASGQTIIPLTPLTGATKRSQCQCVEGFYTPKGQPTGSECLPCPEGAECVGDGEDARIAPVPTAGWYQTEEGSAYMFECESPVACPGGGVGVCGDGFTGHICSDCKDGYFSSAGECKVCQDGSNVAAALGVLIFTCLAAFVYNSANVDRNSGKLRATIAIGAIANAIILFLQIFALLVDIQLRWPPELRRFMQRLAFVNIDLSVLSPECLYDIDFAGRWRLTALMPYAFLCAFLVFAAVRTAFAAFKVERTAFAAFKVELGAEWRADVTRAGPTQLLKSLNATCVCWSLLHVNTSTTILQAFACTEQPDGSRTMPVYPAFDCDSERYQREIMPVAWFTLLTVAVGYPVALGALLWAAGRYTQNEALAQVVQGVQTPFARRYYFWEVLDVCRKLLIAIVLTYGAALTTGKQLAIVTLIMIIALVAQVQCRPFKHVMVNVCSLYLFTVLLFVLVIAGMIFNEQQSFAELEATAEAMIWIGVSSGIVFGLTVIGMSAWAAYRSVRSGNVEQHQVVVTPDLIANVAKMIDGLDTKQLVEHTKEAIDDEETQRSLNDAVCLLFVLAATSEEWKNSERGIHFERILTEAGRSPKEVREIMARLGIKRRVRRTFSLVGKIPFTPPTRNRGFGLVAAAAAEEEDDSEAEGRKGNSGKFSALMNFMGGGGATVPVVVRSEQTQHA